MIMKMEFNKTRIAIFLLQMIAYFSIIPMILFASWHHWLISIFMYFLFGCIGMIMTYHRLLTHRSFKCPLWWEYLGTLLATLSFTGSAITWIAIHRMHHRYADTDKDPHSPDYLGWWRVQFCTAFAPVEGRYAADLMRNKFYLWQHKYYILIGIVFSAILFIFDPFAVVYIHLFPAALTLFFGTLILSTSHYNFKPHNTFWLALITWGDAFHETHHTNANKFRLHRYDFTGWLIEKIFVR